MVKIQGIQYYITRCELWNNFFSNISSWWKILYLNRINSNFKDSMEVEVLEETEVELLENNATTKKDVSTDKIVLKIKLWRHLFCKLNVTCQKS